jgi:hypothetical protein
MRCFEVLAQYGPVIQRSMSWRRGALSLAALLLAPLTFAQSTPQSQLSPEAAYTQVLQPLTITRASVDNWSDAELAALKVAMEQARLECGGRSPQTLRGDDLVALARLCSLGEQWSSVTAAAKQYIESTDTPKPLLAQAYGLEIDAALHIHDEAAALAASHAMLAAVPYDAVVDEALNEALRYLQLAYMPDALALYAERQPLLLAALRAPKADPGAPKPSVQPVSISALYADGLAFAALEQFAGKAAEAAATVADLDAALASAPAPLQPDDALPIADARRQYALLGQPLPKIPLAASLYAEHETPLIDDNYGASTVLFLFPPWCAQCVRMGQSFMSVLLRLSDEHVHLYGLLAQQPPPTPALPAVVVHSNGRMSEAKHGRANAAPPEPETQKTAADLLRHTPTLIVPPDTLTQFAATNFPLLIATDSKGIIRFIQPAPETALNPGDFLDQVTAHIAAEWPRSAK